jgi:hypothetical protein
MNQVLRPAWMQPLFALVMLCVAGCALGLSNWESPESTFQSTYWYVLPPLPFVLLAVLSFGWPQHLGPLCGAAIGAAIAVGVPWGLLKYDSAHYTGGGANIGIGLLLLAMPVYLPLLMLAGYGIAALIRHLSRRARCLPA